MPQSDTQLLATLDVLLEDASLRAKLANPSNLDTIADALCEAAAARGLPLDRSLLDKVLASSAATGEMSDAALSGVAGGGAFTSIRQYVEANGMGSHPAPAKLSDLFKGPR